eukprot:CAMPEP_0113302372 /NCGR_PEP_ID=MMETSP0010_2-20120614/3212_1 /TAXON_ID=216773 ORGANISM="Corethron hystrix, Strain 308" /NCGR_SAMPLE_ID=MMETSP0010_2 /ASSEMBLY_ACC=CAM_ASM_000155 /LENGTH=501 /DNA_ID=CAMNT_0000156151 /DNA_START=64 /DNA_END=1569 /DNA_ORIENTATION=- /assembly_acc=CAM_ASM_000155
MTSIHQPAPVPSSSSDHRAHSTSIPNPQEDDDPSDPIVRELDVYLCAPPNPSSSVHVVQFPLRPSNNPHHSIPGPNPTAGRYKPMNGLLELDFDTTSATGPAEGGRRATRTFASTIVPNRTNIALGFIKKADDFGTDSLYLVPTSGNFQLRPSFHHVDELDGSDEEDEPAKPEQEMTAVNALALRRPENDRQAEFRRTSYAYHRASLEGEVWRSLTVENERDRRAASAVRDAMLSSVSVSPGSGNVGFAPGSARYVRSLNYLPRGGSSGGGASVPGSCAVGIEDDVDHEVVSSSEVITEVPSPAELAASATVLLQNRMAPIPYDILRSSLLPISPPTQTGPWEGDIALLSAMAGCGTFVLGTFVLRSTLCNLSRHMQNVRDAVLWIIQRDGYIRRRCLRVALDDISRLMADDEMAIESLPKVTNEAIELMLKCICRKDVVKRCWEMKVQHLEWKEELEVTYKEYMQPFKQWWERRVGLDEISVVIQRYDEANACIDISSFE